MRYRVPVFSPGNVCVNPRPDRIIWTAEFLEGEHLQDLDVSWGHEPPVDHNAGVVACGFTGRPAGCSSRRRDAATTCSLDIRAARFMENEIQMKGKPCLSFMSTPG